VSGPRIPAEVLDDVAGRVAAVRARIAAACEQAGRAPDDVVLVGASKRQSPERIAAAVVAGVRDLGENYVQEARDKRPVVEALVAAHGATAPRWHGIGPLQRNKVTAAVAVFDCIETVDRLRLAEALARRVDAAGPPLEVLLQVNVSRDPAKAGVDPDAAGTLLAGCAALPELAVCGLMAIPAAHDDPAALRADFRALRALRDTLRARPRGDRLTELSMGMSGDFEHAIAEGATRVRIGTALFGPRPAAGGAAPDGRAEEGSR